MTDPVTVQRYLKGAEYPATKDELLELAEEHDAPEEVVEALEALDDQTYEGPDEVVEALGV